MRREDHDVAADLRQLGQALFHFPDRLADLRRLLESFQFADLLFDRFSHGRQANAAWVSLCGWSFGVS